MLRRPGAPLEKRPEESLDQRRALGQERPQLVMADEQDHRHVRRRHLFSRRPILKELLEADRRRRHEQTRAAVTIRGFRLPIEQHLQALRYDAHSTEHLPRLVAVLACCTREAEQLVDGDGGEYRQLAQAPGDDGGGQRFEPELPHALDRHTLFGKRPRGGLEHDPVARIPMGEYVLDILFERPHPVGSRMVDGQ